VTSHFLYVNQGSSPRWREGHNEDLAVAFRPL
jgi:hypothetical protein